jgi:hypothetical protein
MPHPQVLIPLAVMLSLKSSVSAIPVSTENGRGLIGGFLDDVLGVPTYATQNDQNQKQTIFVTQYVTNPTSLAETDSHEHSTTELLVNTRTITSYVQADVGTPATATATPSTATPQLVPQEANPTSTRMRQPEPTGETPSYHDPSMQRVKGPIVAGYYPDWASGSLSPEQIDWRAFDWVDFGTLCYHEFGVTSKTLT